MSKEKLREGVYLVESKWGHRLVFPLKNEDGKWNKFNLFTGGHYQNLIIIFFIIFLVLAGTLSYRRDLRECSKVANYAVTHPCEWCDIVMSSKKVLSYELEGINWSKFKTDFGSLNKSGEVEEDG